MISCMHRPPPAEGNNLEELLGEEPIPPIPVPKPNLPVWPDETAASYCALTPPLETFMVVPDDVRREQFFRTARPDDMLIGSVSAIQDSGLIITLLAYDQGPRRDFDGLRLTGFCPVRQLPKYATHGNALDAFQMNDKVRAFILDVHHSGRLILSMNDKALNTDLYGNLTLGIIGDDDLPLHYRRLQNLDGKSFESCLEGAPQFRNPDGLRVLCSRFGIPRASACSLLLSMSKIKLPKPEMACELRRVQLYNMSMKHVAQGVKYFKDGRNTEALQCYNFAIEVENSNADAFVARGALYASIGTYVKAIDDLEKSLALQPNHANAKNYLGQTLLAYSCELTSKEPTRAAQMLRRALMLDPNNLEAREALRDLPGGDGASASRDVSMRSWSRSPSPTAASSNPVVAPKRPPPAAYGGAAAHQPPPASALQQDMASHFERSREALVQLVEEDRSRRMASGSSTHREPSNDDDFLSPTRARQQRAGDYGYGDDERPPAAAAGIPTEPKSNLAKIVITRDRSGRMIRCEDEGQQWEDNGGGGGGGDVRNRGHGRDYRRYDDTEEQTRKGYDEEPAAAADDNRDWRADHGRKRRDDWREQEDNLTNQPNPGPEDHQLPQSEFQYDRRVYTPPKDAKEVENGVLTHYVNKSDLPLTSKTLQDRVQQRLKDIERRHGEAGGEGQWRGRGRGGYRGVGGQFFNPRGGGMPPRGRGMWRGGWRGGGGDDGGGGGDWRGGRRGGWYGNRDRYGGPDRRGDGGDGGGDYRPPMGRRRPRYDRSRSGSRSKSPGGVGGGVRSSRRSARAADSRSPSRSRSRSYSRSVSRSPSPYPRKRISRARLRTPPLAPLTNRQSDSEEQLADVEAFVAQLQAKRQAEEEAVSAGGQPLIGPKMPE